jgi:starvation-inducible DNA-binding protein
LWHFLNQKAEPMRLHSTKNDLSEIVRSKAIELLNSRLADCLDLQSQTKQAHWNVRGASFIALHKLFDEISESVEEYSDLIAERAVQLGGIARGTARVVAANSSLSEYPLEINSGRRHVLALTSALAAFGKLSRQAIDRANELGDAVTADVFTEVARGTDKWLWMVEAHLKRARPRRTPAEIDTVDIVIARADNKSSPIVRR